MNAGLHPRSQIAGFWLERDEASAAVLTEAPMRCQIDHGDPPLARRLRGLPVISVLGLHLPVAETRRSRLLGLAHLDRAAAGAGLLLPRCRSVHTYGMRFPIDIVFVDPEGSPLERHMAVGPRRILSCGRAAAVAELVPQLTTATEPR